MDIRKFLGKPKPRASTGPATTLAPAAPSRQTRRTSRREAKSHVLQIDDEDDEDFVIVDDGDQDDMDLDDEDHRHGRSVRRGKNTSKKPTRQTPESSPPSSKYTKPTGKRKNQIDDDDDDDEDHMEVAYGKDDQSVEPLVSSSSVKRARNGPDPNKTPLAQRTARQKRIKPEDDEPLEVAEPLNAMNTNGAGFGGAADTKEVDPQDEDEDQAVKKAKADSYKKFLNRGAPANRGNKERPIGAPNCLEGKVFVITGVLDSLERDECMDLIKQYGGRCVTSVSKKVTHGIVGQDPGESKLSKLKELHIPVIDEDKLFDMINSSNKNLGLNTQKRSMLQTTSSQKHSHDHNVSVSPDAPKAGSFGNSSKPDVLARTTLPGAGRPSASSELWVEKYKPHDLNDLIANPKIYDQIGGWLRSWKSRHLMVDASGGSKSRKGSAAGSRGEDDFAAVLLAGPPGIGKTTAAHVICRANGFEPIEFNASDVRNKGGVEQLGSSLALGGTVTQFFSFAGNSRGSIIKSDVEGHSKKKRRFPKSEPTLRSSASEYPNGPVLIMDEVDGMSGGDRGGSQELLKLIKTTRVPIICICNDDSSQKMRSLANGCYKLKFRRPMPSQVRDRIMMIARKEGFHAIDVQTAERLAEGCHGDIRQMINLLQTWRCSSPSLSFMDVKDRLQNEGKSFEQLNIFDIFQTFFNGNSSNNSVAQRMENFFLDADLTPLFVAENYVSARGARNSRDLSVVADAAEAISEGDLCDALVRREQRWDLMPPYSVLSCVLPGACVTGGLSGRPNFPSYLGNISKRTKFRKLVRELEMRAKAVHASSGSARAFRLDYLPTLTICLATPLIKEGSAGIPDVIERLDAYYFQKDDWNTVLEIGVFKDKRGPLDAIPGRVKATLTREYNKLEHAVSTVTGARIGAKGKQEAGELITKKAASMAEDVGVLDDDGESDVEEISQEDVDSSVAEFKVRSAGKRKRGA